MSSDAFEESVFFVSRGPRIPLTSTRIGADHGRSEPAMGGNEMNTYADGPCKLWWKRSIWTDAIHVGHSTGAEKSSATSAVMARSGLRAVLKGAVRR